ncbi:Sir2 family NAD-dependent protein deacetylase [Paraburkholderia metrosideri]|uniref:Sir2 family NAD-dependent protein deacetylase n=1 Tax=Paraburkholderia metrosideri TaxID=580937 RepID=UPI0038B2F78D
MRHGASVFTSNVDGQFQKAGFFESRVHECHGSIHTLQCTEACSADTWSAEGFHPLVNEKTSEREPFAAMPALRFVSAAEHSDVRRLGVG